jgi:hypothetical protein
MRRLAIVLVASLTACGFGAVGEPSVRVSPPPPGLRVDQAWRAAVTVRNARPRAFVIARSGVRRTFPLERAGARYRAFVSFPTPGAWHYGVRLAARTLFAGSVLVRPGRPAIQQPFGLVEEPAGTLLVADWRAGIIFRLDLRRREGIVLARVRAPRDLTRAPDSRILVASDREVLELDPATGRVRRVATAGAFIGGLAAAADGTLYVNEDQSRIVRIAGDGTRELLASGLDGVHGVLLTPEGLVVCESFGGRVLRLEGAATRVLARGLANPSYAARAADGALYVSEFLAGRVSRLAPDGSIESVGSVPSPGPVLLDRAGRILVGTLDGSIYRIDPATRRSTLVYP